MNMRLRKIIFLSGVFVFALGVHVASAQMTGVISYDVTIDVYMSLTPEQEILKTRLEEFRTTKMLLFFSPDESIYKQDEEARQNRNGGRNFGGGGSPGGFSRGNGGGFNGGGGNPGFGGGAGGRGNGGGFNGGGNGGGNPGGFSRDNGGAGGAGGQGGFDRGAQGGFGGPGGFRGGIGGIAGFGRQGNAEIYISQNSRRTITKQELLGKTYIIEDSLELSPWKLGTDRKIILGYLCKLAYYTDNSDPAKPQEITAWYTDKIRPFVGPENFNTLPGAVLAVDINAGEKVLVATKIDLRPLADAEAIMPPSRDDKAIVTTPANYKKIEEEQLKNLNAGRTTPRN